MCSLSPQLNINFRSLNSLSVITSKIQTNFFPSCSIKASVCKITQAKPKDDGVTRKFEYISSKLFKFQVLFCFTLTFQFSCDAWSLLSAPFSYIENNPFPIHTFWTCTHEKLLRDPLKGFFWKAMPIFRPYTTCSAGHI